MHDSRKSMGKGLPDLLMIHPGRLEVWFVELKTERGRLKPEQKIWGKVLSAVEKASGGRVKYRLWRPSMWERIVQDLGGRDSRLFV